MRSRVFLVIVLVMAVLLVGACHDGSRVGVDSTDIAEGSRVRPFALLRQGLEYRRYVISVSRDVLVGELGSYSVEKSADGDALANLETNGFRLFLIPIDEVEGVLHKLHPEPIHDSTWLGLLSSWIPVAEGPIVRGTRVLKISDEQLSYNNGRFRLLVRTYPVVVDQDANKLGLRVELLPQWHHYLPMGNLLPVNPQDREMAGRLFTELGDAVNLSAKKTLFILGDDPAGSWYEPAQDDGNAQSSSSEAENDSAAGGKNEEPVVMEDQTQGPRTMAIKTIGEEILNSARDNQQMILVFIPHFAKSRTRNRQ